jgi:hypothetical protein
MGRFCGWLLIVGDVLFTLAGFLHPQGHGDDFHEAVSGMLSNSHWPIAHLLAMVSALLLTWTFWLLTDAGWANGSVIGRAGSRLTILGGTFMAVQFAVELAAHHEAAAVAASQSEPLTNLTQSMQAVGWPVWALGFGLLAIGITGIVPRIVSALCCIGALAFALGGILTMGFELPQAGVLFPIGSLVGLWIIWIGIQFARDHGSLAALQRVSAGQDFAESTSMTTQSERAHA